MTDTNRKRVETYLRDLETALEGSPGQSGEIVEEVRADLEAHVERFVAEGRSEEEALSAALEEMGNPYELAHHMKREIPPFGGKALTVIRYVMASGVILWTLLLLWNFRAWSYGFSPAMIGVVVFFHLPGILLLWPRIVWRKNWLFGLIPAGLAVLVALFITLGGVESSGTIEVAIPEAGEAPVAPAPMATADPEPSQPRPVVIAIALAAFSLVLLLAMQQRTQRRIAFLAIVVGVAAIEVIFQGEEFIFRQDRERIRDFVETSFRKDGSYPTKEDFKAEGPELRSESVMFNIQGEDFSIFWSRPLSSGFAIVYESGDDRIRIQD